MQKICREGLTFARPHAYTCLIVHRYEDSMTNNMESGLMSRRFTILWRACSFIGLMLFFIAVFIFFLPAWLADLFDL